MSVIEDRVRIGEKNKMSETGEIQDGKTIMLLQYATLKGFID